MLTPLSRHRLHMTQTSSSALLLGVLLLSLFTSSTSLSRPIFSGAHDEYRQKLLVEAVSGPTSPIEMEIVVARYKENTLLWLGDIPDFYHVTIYNKGGSDHPMPEPPAGRFWDVVDLPNVGREDNTFSEHLVRRYDNLASYTIFTQADPFVHNKDYLALLQTPALLGNVQTMSRVYKRDGDQRFRTPGSVVEKMSKHPLYRSERLSLRTLNSVWYHDEGAVGIQRRYLREHRLSPGTNLIRHHFGLMGLPDWIPEEQEVGSFAFGGLVGFERSRALQHPRRCYELLLNTTKSHKETGNPWMIERMWIMLFGGPDFRD